MGVLRIDEILKEKGSAFSVVHNHSVYDFLVWIFGIPLAFWICFKVSPMLEAVALKTSVFLQSAIYVYLFFGILILFRIVFHYLRWVCPLVEFKSKGNAIYLHRTAIGAIILGLAAQYIYAIFDIIF